MIYLLLAALNLCLLSPLTYLTMISLYLKNDKKFKLGLALIVLDVLSFVAMIISAIYFYAKT